MEANKDKITKREIFFTEIFSFGKVDIYTLNGMDLFRCNILANGNGGKLIYELTKICAKVNDEPITDAILESMDTYHANRVLEIIGAQMQGTKIN